MAKSKTMYVCGECGYTTPKWLGKCPDCGKWNTFAEEVQQPEVEEKKLKRAPGRGGMALPIGEIPDEAAARMSSGIGELDRVLGGGVVEGSMVLVGGDPGIGKSTLLTQLSANLSARGDKVLYVSGEESMRQIKLRATRLGADGSGFYVLAENDVSIIEERMLAIQPRAMVIDSIQTMYRTDISSSPGSVSQVRECAAHIMRLAKMNDCAVFLVGHVTKEGAIAGPRVLEHMVDAVLYFEGDRSSQYRLLRAALTLYNQDVYINIAGGMTLTEPAADLAVCAAVASSSRNLMLGPDWAVMGEVGLAGELRAVPHAERRLSECMRLGFQNVILPKSNLRGVRVPEGMNAIGAETLFDALKLLGIYNNPTRARS